MNTPPKVESWLSFDNVTKLSLSIPPAEFQEEALLIREEYVTAFDTFKDWNLLGRGGVVVTGQPGIDAC